MDRRGDNTNHPYQQNPPYQQPAAPSQQSGSQLYPQGWSQQQQSQGNFPYQDPNQQPPMNQQQYPPGALPPDVMRTRRLTKQEMEVMRECMKESFWKRCVPFAGVAVGGVLAGRHQGFIPPHRVGWYAAGAAFAGYLAGKISYVNVCGEKLRKLPNSSLGDNRGDMFQEMAPLPGMDTFSQFRSAPPDDYQKSQQTADDIYHDPAFASTGSSSAVPQAQDSTAAQKKTTTYEELRAKNRSAYWRQQQGVPHGQPVNQPQQPNRPPDGGDRQQ